jgi:hypothetical protein
MFLAWSKFIRTWSYNSRLVIVFPKSSSLLPWLDPCWFCHYYEFGFCQQCLYYCGISKFSRVFCTRLKLSMSRMTSNHLSKYRGSNGRLSTFDIKHWLASIDGWWWWYAYCCLSKCMSLDGKLLAFNMKHWLASITIGDDDVACYCF